MALLEKLEPGNVYLVKISASNQVGDGPFSNIVELPLKRGNTRSKNPRHSDSFPDTTGKHHETYLTLYLLVKMVCGEWMKVPLWRETDH